MDPEDTIAVQVDDLDSIQVAVDGANPDAGTQKTVAEKEPKPAKEAKPRTRRVSPDPEPPVDHTAALEEARAFAKQQEDARKAAEATAASERARADAADQARQRALKDAEDATERASNSELTLIESSLAAANRELEAQQDAYTRAAEAGEFANMAKIQVKIAKAAAAIDRLEDTKASIEANPRKAAPVEPTQRTSSPQDGFLASFSPTTQNFLRQHMDCLPPQFGGDQSKNNKMMSGHHAALAQGFAADSSEYFRVIEEHIGTKQPVVAAAPASVAAEVIPAARAERSTVPSAPVSREAPLASGATPPRNVREVRLSRDQQEMAKLSFPHLPQDQAFGMYARNLIELEAEGKLGRTSH